MNSKIAICLVLLIICITENYAQVNYDSLVKLPITTTVSTTALRTTVKTASRYVETTAKAPATILVITKQQIESNGWQDLSDVLKNIPGLDIVDHARGYGEFYIFRGIEGNDRFLVLIDGQKINPTSGTFLSVGNSIAVGFAEQIEIVFGPSSVMYGADAFSGVVNSICKRDSCNDITVKSDNGVANTHSGIVAANYKTRNDIMLSAYFRYFRSDGSDFIGRDPIYDTIINYKPPKRNSFEQPVLDHTLFMKAQYKHLTLSYFRQRFDEGNAYGQAPHRVIYNKECKWAMSNNVVALTYDNQIDTNKAISFDVAYIYHFQDPNTQFYKWNTIKDSANNQYMTGLDKTFRTATTYNQILFRKFKVIAGLEYEYTNSIPPYANDQILASAVKFEGEYRDTIVESLTINEQRFAGYAQLNYSHGSKLDIILGGRYDYSSSYKLTFNPRISIVYSPWTQTNFKLLYGTAFQSPSLLYQYEQWGSSTAVMLSERDKDSDWKLKNQEVTTYELNVNQLISKYFSLHFTASYSQLNNLIEREEYTDSVYNKYFSTAETKVFSRGFRNANIGKQDIKSFNFRCNYYFKERITGYLAYTYIDPIVKVKNGLDKKIPRIAAHKFWFGFVYNNLFDHITIATQLKWIGKIYNRNAIVFPNNEQPGYFNADISLKITGLVKYINFFARCENVFNNKYDHGGMYDQTLYLPVSTQPGIIFRAGFEFSLNDFKNLPK